MGMLLFVQNGIDASPYSEVLDNEMWLEIYEQFNRDACKLLGVVEESALTTCVNAGCTAIPALLNIKNMMKDKQVNSIWSARDELPVSIACSKSNSISLDIFLINVLGWNRFGIGKEVPLDVCVSNFKTAVHFEQSAHAVGVRTCDFQRGPAQTDTKRKQVTLYSIYVVCVLI